jgi:hypothetical protein
MGGGVRRWLAGIAVLCASPAWAATYFVTIAGLGGEPEYEQRFHLWAQEIERVLKSGPEARIETLSGARSTRENVRAALERVRAQAGPSDALVIMLIGHGTYDGMDYKINLPGPDLTAAELAAMLDRIPAGRQLVVNMTSASGGASDVLAKPSRAVISATKSGTEKNATIFARYWVEALSGDAADFDKNQTISAAEAFRYAKEKTARFYESERRLATEHPVLNGEAAASGFVLVRHGATAAFASDPAKRQLLARREELEQQIDRLKLAKPTMPAADYRKQIAALLLELARTQEELEK